MQNIDLNKLKVLKERLEKLEEDEVLYLDDNDETKYVVLKADYFDELESYRALFDEEDANKAIGPNVQIVAPMINQLSYEDYEKIKQQLNEVFDETFKPKPDKLN